MKGFKILLFICLLLNYSNCVNENESNDLVNTLSLNRGNKYTCTNGVGTITFYGTWEDIRYPMDSFDFEINLEDGTKFACSYNKAHVDEISCPLIHQKVIAKFSDQYMDPNNAYLLKASELGTYTCSSLYIYSNLLLLLIMIFILFN